MTVAARGEVDFAATRYGRWWHPKRRNVRYTFAVGG